MIVRYHVAIISFCADLVSPEEAAVPVGLLIVGEAGHKRFALLQTDQHPELPEMPDPLDEPREARA